MTGTIDASRRAMVRDYRRIPYTKVRRPVWPLDGETSPGLIF